MFHVETGSGHTNRVLIVCLDVLKGGYNSKVDMDHNHRSSDLLLLTKTPAAAPQNTLNTVIFWSFSFTCKILSFSMVRPTQWRLVFRLLVFPTETHLVEEHPGRNIDVHVLCE